MDYEPKIEYETNAEGKTVPIVKGGNGEVQHRGERYASKSNAKRGLEDLARSFLVLMMMGELHVGPEPEPVESPVELEPQQPQGAPPDEPPYEPPNVPA